MSFSFGNSLLKTLPHARWPLLLYTATWMAILTATVVVASFTLEIAFVSAITPNSSLSQACCRASSVRLPLDIPSEKFCFLARLFKRSRIDVVVLPVFAAVVVATSASLVKAIGL